eukprot:214734_1
MSQLDEDCPSENNAHNPHRNNQESRIQNIITRYISDFSNKMELKHIIGGALIAFIFYYVVIIREPYNLEKEYYNAMGSSIMTRQSFWEYKYSHDLIDGAINSIELKSKNSYVSHQQNSLAKTNLKQYKPDLKFSLRTQLKYDKLPTDLDNKIELAINQAKYLKSGKDTYIQVDLSDEFGGTHYVGFGVLGFIEDPNNNDTVMVGVSVYREEWSEQDWVRLKTENIDRKDVERYIQYELYERIYEKMDVNYRSRINSKDDFETRVKNGNRKKINCQNTPTHIIFINDKSGSMTSRDNGLSMPEYSFIKGTGYLENRLGSLYSAIQDFIQVRYDNNCDDVISAVLFDSNAQIASTKTPLTETYVKDYLIKISAGGGTNFGKGFEKANTLINNYDEDTLVIFLTDGESKDDGASNVVSKWKKNMGDKLTLYCVVLGREPNKSVVKRICDKGDGEMKETLNGAELIEIYNEIVWKEIKRS